MFVYVSVNVYVRVYVIAWPLGQEGGEQRGGHAASQRRCQGDVLHMFGFSFINEWVPTCCLLFVESGPSLDLFHHLEVEFNEKRV